MVRYLNHRSTIHGLLSLWHQNKVIFRTVASFLHLTFTNMQSWMFHGEMVEQDQGWYLEMSIVCVCFHSRTTAAVTPDSVWRHSVKEALVSRPPPPFTVPCSWKNSRPSSCSRTLHMKTSPSHQDLNSTISKNRAKQPGQNEISRAGFWA